jgi:hypothetical protein
MSEPDFDIDSLSEKGYRDIMNSSEIYNSLSPEES